MDLLVDDLVPVGLDLILLEVLKGSVAVQMSRMRIRPVSAQAGGYSRSHDGNGEWWCFSLREESTASSTLSLLGVTDR